MIPRGAPFRGSCTKDASTRSARDTTGAERLPSARTSSGSCGFSSASASGERPPRVPRFRPLRAQWCLASDHVPRQQVVSDGIFVH